MSKIENPSLGQLFWTVTNGQICQRIYGGPSPLYNGHVIKIPGVAEGRNSYYVDHVFAFEKKSDILAIHLEAARKAAEQAAAKVPWVELEYRNALKAEREAAYTEQADLVA